MTHDAREYKNKIMALNTFATDVDFCNAVVDEWAEAMADSMQTLDNVVPDEFYPDCPTYQELMEEME